MCKQIKTLNLNKVALLVLMTDFETKIIPKKYKNTLKPSRFAQDENLN